MGELSWWHWLIVVLIFVLLFGSKRLPDAARSLGKSMRILTTEIKGLHDDDTTEPTAPPAALPPPAAMTADAPPPAAPAAAPAAGESTDSR